MSAYSASKHGMIGFIDALRVELMHDRAPISVMTILPAGINTPFFDKSLTRLEPDCGRSDSACR